MVSRKSWLSTFWTAQSRSDGTKRNMNMTADPQEVYDLATLQVDRAVKRWFSEFTGAVPHSHPINIGALVTGPPYEHVSMYCSYSDSCCTQMICMQTEQCLGCWWVGTMVSMSPSILSSRQYWETETRHTRRPGYFVVYSSARTLTTHNLLVGFMLGNQLTANSNCLSWREHFI